MDLPANKILIVEDSKSIRRALKPRLENVCGVEVLLAETYAQAVDIIDTQGPNLFLAILDLTLPDAMHGEVVEYARTHEVPNLVFTSSLDATVRETILSKGTIDYREPLIMLSRVAALLRNWCTSCDVSSSIEQFGCLWWMTRVLPE